MSFETMDEKKRFAICSAGGKAAHRSGRAHEFSSEEAKRAGKKGAEALKKKYGPDHFAKIGRRGGEAVARDKRHMSEIGRKGGEAVARDKDHMAEIGRKGGSRSTNLELPFD